MEQQLSDVLDNLLGLLLLEGSYEIEETEDGFIVSIETQDAGRLIGVKGESLDALQLIINQIMSRKQREPVSKGAEGFKRVILDVSGWRKQREEDLKRSAEDWGKQVMDSGKEMELEPMSSWQRRVVHMVVGEMKGLKTESLGEGRDRHVVIKLKTPAKGEARQSRQKSKVPSKTRLARLAAKQRDKVGKSQKDQSTDAETKED